MGILSCSEWEKINNIILTINREEDSRKMRKAFLEQLRRVVVFNIGEFSLGNDEYKFFDSVEVNMDTEEEIKILERYYEYKDAHGNKNIDWVFRTPNSTVVKGIDIIRDGIFEETKFSKIFLKNIGMKYICTMSLSHDSKFLGELSIYLSDGYMDFSERDIYILDILKEHLASRLYRDLGKKVHLSEEQTRILIRSDLSEREIEVFKLAISGMSNDSIAQELFISVATVKKHMGNVLEKLNVKNRTRLRIFFDEHSE